MDKYYSANRDTLFYRRNIEGYKNYVVSDSYVQSYTYHTDFFEYEEVISYSSLDSSIYDYILRHRLPHLKDLMNDMYEGEDPIDTIAHRSEDFCDVLVNEFVFGTFSYYHLLGYGKGLGFMYY